MYRDTGCFDETYKQRGKELDDLFSKKLDELSKIKNNYEQKAIDNGEITKEEAEELRKRVDNSREKITDYNKQLYRKFLNYVSNIDNSLLTGTTGDFDTCEGILGPDVMHDISKYLGYLRILAPILVIILSAVDYGKAVLSDDDKALGKATSNLVKRLIIAAIVCFAPLILMYLVDAASKFVESSWNGCDLREWWSW